MQLIENPVVGSDNASWEPKPLISNVKQIQSAVYGKHEEIILQHK